MRTPKNKTKQSNMVWWAAAEVAVVISLLAVNESTWAAIVSAALLGIGGFDSD